MGMNKDGKWQWLCVIIFTRGVNEILPFPNIVKTSVIFTLCMSIAAVQNERQPRNTATIRPENLKEMDPESIIREASVAVGAFG